MDAFRGRAPIFWRVSRLEPYSLRDVILISRSAREAWKARAKKLHAHSRWLEHVREIFMTLNTPS